MKKVGILEAKTNLSALVSEVESTGEAIAITRHGKRIADLTPPASSMSRGVGESPPRPWSEVVKEIREWREEMARKHPGLSEPYDLRADRDSIE